MSWRVTLAVLAVALVSVIYGLDWQGPPQAPQYAASTAVQQPIVFPDQTPWPAATDLSPSSNAPVLPNGDNAAQSSRAQATDVVAPPGCNVTACEAAYRSFRASDCTYQPNNGPRRLCKRK